MEDERSPVRVFDGYAAGYAPEDNKGIVITKCYVGLRLEPVMRVEIVDVHRLADRLREGVD